MISNKFDEMKKNTKNYRRRAENTESSQRDEMLIVETRLVSLRRLVNGGL